MKYWLQTDARDLGIRSEKTPSARSKDGNINNITHAVKDVHIVPEIPKVKSKDLDVGAEYAKTNAKHAANFVVIGEHHIPKS